MLNVTSKEEAADKYLDSLGEYQLLQDITQNGHPVYQSLAKGDKYIIYIGKKNIYSYLNFSKYFTPGYHWYITQNISNNAVKEFRSSRKGQVVVPELGWQYSNFTNCKTER